MRVRADNTLTVVWTIVVRVLVIAALLWLAWEIRSVLTTIILAVMLTYLLLPAVDYLCSKRPIRRRNKRLTRLIATVLVFIAFFIVVGAATELLFWTFKTEAGKLHDAIFPHDKPVWESLGRVWGRFTELQKSLPPDWAKFLEQQKQNINKAAAGFVAGMFRNTFSWLGNVVEMILIPVLAFYFLLDYRTLKREIIGLVPSWRVRDALRFMRHTGDVLQNYVIGQLVLCLLAGLITALVLQLAGMKYVLFLSIFAGVTRAIPIIGPVVSGVPICLFGWNQGGIGMAAWLLIFVTVMHFAESKFIMPILIGERMKLHPAVILISLLIGAELFGLLGMFIAAPFAAVVRDLLNVYVVRKNTAEQVKCELEAEVSA